MRAPRRAARVAGVLGLTASVALGACGASPTGDAARATTTASASLAASGTDPTADPDASRTALARLEIDDQSRPGTTYRREDWPTWLDIDHDGCDARSQALIAQSTTRAQVSFPGCQVVAGDWTSPYDGVETSNPGDLDADHLVPLENVHESGGWRWDAARRRAYANDQAVLVMVTAHANRSKGSKAPDQWRPALESYWCTYATRWVALKLQWQLTATTAERDALGQMLDRCVTP
jgi:stage V sporulation protein SpoVS